MYNETSQLRCQHDVNNPVRFDGFEENWQKEYLEKSGNLITPPPSETLHIVYTVPKSSKEK